MTSQASNRVLKRRLRACIALALVGLFVVLLCSWIIGSALLAPAQRPVQLRDQGTAVTFRSESGAELKGNFWSGSRGAVALMHGVRGNRADMAEHAAFLNRAGYSVLIFDFQSHGESSGNQITNGYLESKDAVAAVNFLRENCPGQRIAILGVSLGGAAALLAGPDLRADAMVLEMVYPDIDRAVKNRIAMVAGNWTRPFSPLLTWQLKPRVGVGADWFSPEREIAKVMCPKLIISGDRDLHTTLSDTESLYQAAGGRKELWIVKGATHENLHAREPIEYERRVLEFLEGALR